MKVIRKKPGMAPELVEIENSLESLQAEVDGYIECITLWENMVLICDEEGLLKDKPVNRYIGWSFAGTVLVVGVDGEEFCDVPVTDALMRRLIGRAEPDPNPGH